MSTNHKNFILIQKMLKAEVIQVRDLRYDSYGNLYKKYKKWTKKSKDIISKNEFIESQVVGKILSLVDLNYIYVSEITTISYTKYLELVIDMIETYNYRVEEQEIDMRKYIRIESAIMYFFIVFMWVLILKFSVDINPEFLQWLLILPGIFITKKILQNIRK